MFHGVHGGYAAAELKQQGAIEAAQDANSSVSAADAERSILNESKRAGAAAFQFDPNASAQDKARQAKAVSRGSSLEGKPVGSDETKMLTVHDRTSPLNCSTLENIKCQR